MANDTVDTITSALTAVGSGGALFVIARWLWRYEAIVTARYEKRVVALEAELQVERTRAEEERVKRRAVEDENADLRWRLRAAGLDPDHS